MDGEQVTSLPSEDEDELSFSYKKFFDEQFPYYLFLGMTYNEYWRMDCELVRAYRKAYEYKQEYDNSQLWLQGLYVYRAMEAQRPGWAFMSKRPPKPEKYLEKPIPITDAMKNRYQAEETQKMAEQFRASFHRRNQNLAQQEEGENGTGNIKNNS